MPITHHEKFRNFIRGQISGDLQPDALHEELENHLLQVSRMRSAMAKKDA